MNSTWKKCIDVKIFHLLSLSGGIIELTNTYQFLYIIYIPRQVFYLTALNALYCSKALNAKIKIHALLLLDAIKRYC